MVSIVANFLDKWRYYEGSYLRELQMCNIDINEGSYLYCTKKHFVVINSCGNDCNSMKLYKIENFIKIQDMVPFRKSDHIYVKLWSTRI